VVNYKLYNQTVVAYCTQDITKDQYFILSTVSVFTQKREERNNSCPTT